jgi:hypothetical protein
MVFTWNLALLCTNISFTSGVLKLFSPCTTNFFLLHLCTTFPFRKHIMFHNTRARAISCVAGI